jgi:hypothetical protein
MTGMPQLGSPVQCRDSANRLGVSTPSRVDGARRRHPTRVHPSAMVQPLPMVLRPSQQLPNACIQDFCHLKKRAERPCSVVGRRAGRNPPALDRAAKTSPSFEGRNDFGSVGVGVVAYGVVCIRCASASNAWQYLF